MTIVNRIKDLLGECNMTIAELERVLELSQGSIGKWTKSVPRVDKVSKIADYFDVSIDYLIGRESYEDMKLKRTNFDFISKESEELYSFRRDFIKLDEHEIEHLHEIMKVVFKFEKP